MATPSRERQLVGNVWQYRTVEEGGGNGGAQTVEAVRMTITPATADILTGAVVATLNDGDMLAYSDNAVLPSVFVSEAWDGTTPTLHGLLDNGVDAPYDASGNTIDLAQADSQVIVASPGSPDLYSPQSTNLFTGNAVQCRGGSVDLLVYVDDGAAGPPGSTQGEAEIAVLIYRATA